MVSASAPTSETPLGVPTRRACERAVSLIEVVVVMLIVAIMVAAAVLTLDGDGTTAKRANAISAARMLGDAIEDFRKDHAGRPPAIGTDGWPSSSLKRGPVNTYTGRPYLRQRSIEAIRPGIAQVVSGSTVAANARFSLQYNAAANRPGGWYIVVRDRLGKVRPCHVTGGSITVPAAGGPPC